MTILLTDMSTRNQLAQKFRERSCTQGVEVGTHRGLFAHTILCGWSGILHCVDPWSVPEGYEGQAQTLKDALGGAITREGDYEATKELLDEFSPRFQLHRLTSVQASTNFSNSSVDFVYLDGDHQAHKVEEDLLAWWPKISPGGMMCGHDFICPGEVEGGWTYHIQRAIKGFMEKLNLNLDVYLIPEEGGLPWSYILEKP